MFLKNGLNPNWSQPPFPLPIDLVFQCPWLTQFKLILVDSKKRREIDEVTPSFFFALFISCPFTAHICTMHLKILFDLCVTDRSVPWCPHHLHSSGIWPTVVPQKQIKSRWWFPILKILMEVFLLLMRRLSLGCCTTFQMIVYSEQSHRGDEKYFPLLNLTKRENCLR